METNILGLPSLTGYTPLKAAQEGQVLKYDFRGIGPIVVDKSGNGNYGRLKPIEDPPRRKIVSWFPLKFAMIFDGENDYIQVSDDPSLDITDELTVSVRTKFPVSTPDFFIDKEGSSTSSFKAQVNDGKFWFYTDHDRPRPSKVMSTDTWYRLRGVFDNGKITTFINGEEDISETGFTLSANDQPLRIGWGDEKYFTGRISDVRIYNRAIYP